MHSPDDPYLLQTAAHELGHALVNTVFGITILSIEVDRRDHTGLVRIDLDPATCTPDQLRGALISNLAGFEAERLWCHRHGGTADRACSRTDFAHFRSEQHRTDLTRAAARARARSVLIRHWPRIERLTPHLARRGFLAPDAMA